MGTVTLRTDRLVLVPLAAADVDALHALWTDPLVRRFLWDDRTVTRAEVGDLVATMIGDAAGGRAVMWTARLREEPTRVIGFSGFRPGAVDEELELLYGLEPAWWGHGLATEASGAVVDHAFAALGAACVVASCDEPNVASAAVMRRLGMLPRAPAGPGLLTTELRRSATVLRSRPTAR